MRLFGVGIAAQRVKVEEGRVRLLSEYQLLATSADRYDPSTASRSCQFDKDAFQGLRLVYRRSTRHVLVRRYLLSR
jgi:hypothetical protein